MTQEQQVELFRAFLQRKDLTGTELQLQERLHASLKTKGELGQKHKESAQVTKNLEDALWAMTQRVETLAELAVAVQAESLVLAPTKVATVADTDTEKA